MQRFYKRQCARHATTWRLPLLLALGVTLPAQAALDTLMASPILRGSTAEL